MKKTISLILALALCLVLFACGNEQQNVDTAPDPGTTAPAEETTAWPEETTQAEETEELQDLTDEEYQLLARFSYISRWLEDYAESGEALVYQKDGEHYRGQNALALVYKDLCEMEGFEDIIAAKGERANWTFGEQSWDRQALIDNFTMLSDVKTHQTLTTTEEDGSVSSKTQISWKYNEDGTLCWEDRIYLAHFSYYDCTDYDRFVDEYDGNGRLILRTYYEGSDDDVRYTVTYTYDANGHLTNERYALYGKDENGKDFAITCDDQGRVIQIHWQDFYDSTINYVYDDAGRLIKEEKLQSYNGLIQGTIEYHYDENGVLDSAVYTDRSTGFSNSDDTEWICNLDYTCDEQGREISVTMYYNDMYYTTGDNAGTVYHEITTASHTLDTIYGDYYFYNP